MECRTTLCEAYVTVDSAIAQAIQQALGSESPMTGLPQESLGGELELASQMHIAQDDIHGIIVTLRRRDD